VKHVACMEGIRNAYEILVGKGRDPLGRPTCRWEEHITMDLSEIWWEVVDWTGTSGGLL